jgi:hypothetical protein
MKNLIVSAHKRWILALCFLGIVSGSTLLRAASPEEVGDAMMAAMASQPIWGDPTELDGNRLVFTNWYFIRPGNIYWRNDDDEFVNTLEEYDENPIYGPWDAHLDRPSSPFGIEIVAQPAERVGPIIERENPWEEGYIIFKTVLKDGDIYKAWGKSSPGGDCYLESKDGWNWERPILRQKEFNGSLENNLLKPGQEGTVFIDPNAPPEERYKSVRGPRLNAEEFLAFREKYPDKWETRAVRGPWRTPSRVRAVSGAVSPDGIHWKHLEEPFTVEHSDGMEVGYFDIHRKKYVIYTRTWMVVPRSERWTGDPQLRTWAGELHGSGRRVIGLMESDTFGNFQVSEPCIVPVASETSPSEVFYTSIRTTIPGAPDHHLMFPTVWDMRDDSSSIGLWSSHDGKIWDRIPGGAILETAAFGEWDGGCIFSFPDLIELPNGDFALPYKGYNLPHKYPRGHMTLSAGYALWPKGRIVAVQAKEYGEFTTVGLIPPGKTLKINSLSQRAGGIRVALASITDETLPGRSFDDCDPIRGDHFWTTVTWNGESDLGLDEGEGVVIRFQMDRAKLFGIEFE